MQRIIFLISIYLLLPSLASFAYGISDENISLKAQLVLEDNKLYLHFMIKNNQKKVISIDRHDLPWTDPSNLIIIPIKIRNYEQLNYFLPVYDTDEPAVIHLKSGELLKGKSCISCNIMNLNYLLPRR